MELALDSNVLSFGSGAFLDSSVSMIAFSRSRTFAALALCSECRARRKIVSARRRNQHASRVRSPDVRAFSTCHSERSEAESRNLSSDSSFDRSSAHDETSTAARTHRVRRNMSRRIGAAAARSFYFDAKNNVASTHALSIHRSGMLAAAHTQKASRNLQSSAPRLAMRTGVFGGQHQTTPTTLRDPLRRS